MPGARSFNIVTMKLTAPSIEEMPRSMIGDRPEGDPVVAASTAFSVSGA